MMTSFLPDLDRYAATVLGAYGVTLLLLALLVGASWWRSARVKMTPPNWVTGRLPASGISVTSAASPCRSRSRT